MKVSDIMSGSPVTVAPDETALHAARLLSRHNVGSLPVCGTDGSLRGVVTDRDIVLRCVANGESPAKTPVRDIMSRSVVTASPEDDISRVSELMSRAQVRRLPVVSEGQLVGVIALGDLARRTACDMEASKALTDISANLKRL
ncbi:MAG: CBS domain-containing protein [Oscillospiraceae bacterium]|nr:CBS domain-containing protein [Oscillospiraceae bacterium]MBQ1729974.1 CBS domain-containing protein [Oscillospiraceae bacterium]MBQ1768228.1 CBS domain-containing protein [Oscillospiraceae bacterium]MBQ2157402.1 CBS domain-containing protein [Oscillospiraceae bacterium]MBQ2231533.1 CBS domain-containing protein [Oscillospiraceae bacterium]